MFGRTSRVAAMILVAVIGAVALGWFVALPRYRPGLGDSEQYGIDVSHHQGEIDWEAVAGDDIVFAYLKATEGGDWVDPRFVENWSAARGAGLEVGAYHFFRTCTDGALQAQNFLSTVPLSDSALPLAIDIEGDGICAETVSETKIHDELMEMVDLVEAERGPVIFYVLDGFSYLDDIVAQRQRWQRSLFRRPGDNDWQVWQASNQASVDGIDGRVDLNVHQVGP
ncbi:MAG: lysozyme M1 (1,4-beta-N-acetylmuramidase) [Actinomycetia bacterium]|nr:lysozyme M1 (1,4-beta-N-acetylmuramidase) [Actinomycetes bacterium]